MDCDKYLELMSAALDGELTADERRDLDSHLAVCSECAELFETLSANAKAMRDLDCEVPAGLKERIMNNLPEQEKPVAKIESAPKTSKTGKVIRWKRWAPVAAAACLALVIALVPKSGMSMNAAAPSAEAPAAAEPDTPNSPRAPGAAPMPSAEMEHYVITDSNSTAYATEPSENLQMGGLVDPAEPSAANPDADGKGTASPVEPSYAFENQRSIRVSYGATPAPGAKIIGSAEALENYLAQFGSNAFDSEGNPVPNEKLESLKETYTEEFFRTGRLLCVVVESGSGSNRYEIASQGLLRNSVTVLAHIPEIGTCDMAAWLLVAEVDTMFNDGDILDVNFTR